jgi:hypothetical protein
MLGSVGMFDTIHLAEPLVCPECGAEARSLQTKEFGAVMEHYRIGSVVSNGPVHTGIVKERLWCSACHDAGCPGESPVWLVIWHTVLAGVEQELAKAEARLAAVDRLDLIGWLDEAQRESARWQRRYRGLFNDVRRWHENLVRPREFTPQDEDDASAEPRRAIARFFDLPDEILNSPDPLGAILAQHEHSDDEAED